MNEIITRLAEQADPDHWHKRWFSGVNPRRLDPEITVLLELVIKECAHVAWINTPDYEELDYSHLIADKIKKHFGVE